MVVLGCAGLLRRGEVGLLLLLLLLGLLLVERGPLVELEVADGVVAARAHRRQLAGGVVVLVLVVRSGVVVVVRVRVVRRRRRVVEVMCCRHWVRRWRRWGGDRGNIVEHEAVVL